MTTPDQPMIPERYHPYLWILAAVVALLAWVSIAHATAAGPDYARYNHQDATFLRALDAAQMTYSTPAAAIETGKLIGSQYDAGNSMATLKAQFHVSAVAAHSTYTTWQLDRMVEAGVASYATRRYSTR